MRRRLALVAAALLATAQAAAAAPQCRDVMINGPIAGHFIEIANFNRSRDPYRYLDYHPFSCDLASLPCAGISMVKEQPGVVTSRNGFFLSVSTILLDLPGGPRAVTVWVQPDSLTCIGPGR